MNTLTKRLSALEQRSTQTGYHGVFIYYNNQPTEADAMTMTELDRQGNEYLAINIMQTELVK